MGDGRTERGDLPQLEEGFEVEGDELSAILELEERREEWGGGG